jgi:hypothetical protein
MRRHLEQLGQAAMDLKKLKNIFFSDFFASITTCLTEELALTAPRISNQQDPKPCITLEVALGLSWAMCADEGSHLLNRMMAY